MTGNLIFDIYITYSHYKVKCNLYLSYDAVLYYDCFLFDMIISYILWLSLSVWGQTTELRAKLNHDR